MQYRKEIDGLRAIAVLPVILFHTEIALFSGGFVGVDVFFVISGYLITSILLRELEGERFSIVRFYERRARRLLPALFLVTLACLPFAWMWMLPAQMEEFAGSLISVSLFFSNIFFYLESGYFAAAALERPMLHMWSLAVEEQYYLFFPIVLALFWKWGRKPMIWMLVLTTLGSLALAQWGGNLKTSPPFVENDFLFTDVPGWAFFMTPTRIWELLLGALAGVFLWKRNPDWSSPLMHQLGSALGLALVLYSIVVFTPDTPHPSFWTLIPVLGTALILLFAIPETRVAKALSISPMVMVGLVSYSAYLWHQPLFAFAHLYGAEHPPKWVLLVLGALSIVLAYGTWRWVENPFRNKERFSSAWIFKASLVGTLLMAGVGTAGVVTDGFLFRYNEDDKALASLETEAVQAYQEKVFRDHKLAPFKDDQFKVLVIGDSYGQDFVNALDAHNLWQQVSLSTYHIDVFCGNLWPRTSLEEVIAESQRAHCSRHLKYEDPELQKRIAQADQVLLVSSWARWHVPYIAETVERISEVTSGKVHVVGSKSFGHLTTRNYREFLEVPPADRLTLRIEPDSEVRAADQELKAALAKENYLGMFDVICEGKNTCPLFTPGGSLISFDGGHLTPEGAHLTGSLLREKSGMSWMNTPAAP